MLDTAREKEQHGGARAVLRLLWHNTIIAGAVLLALRPRQTHKDSFALSRATYPVAPPFYDIALRGRERKPMSQLPPRLSGDGVVAARRRAVTLGGDSRQFRHVGGRVAPQSAAQRTGPPILRGPRHRLHRRRDSIFADGDPVSFQCAVRSSGRHRDKNFRIWLEFAAVTWDKGKGPAKAAQTGPSMAQRRIMRTASARASQSRVVL